VQVAIIEGSTGTFGLPYYGVEARASRFQVLERRERVQGGGGGRGGVHGVQLPAMYNPAVAVAVAVAMPAAVAVTVAGEVAVHRMLLCWHYKAQSTRHRRPRYGTGSLYGCSLTNGVGLTMVVYF